MICKGEVDKLKRNLPFFSQKWYAFRFKWALVFASYVYLMSSWLIILYLLIIHFFSPDSLLLRQYPDETEVLTPLMWTLCPQCVRFVHLQLIEKKKSSKHYQELMLLRSLGVILPLGMTGSGRSNAVIGTPSLSSFFASFCSMGVSRWNIYLRIPVYELKEGIWTISTLVTSSTP